MAGIKEVIRCYSCGKILQSDDENAPGYIKKEVLESERQSFFFCDECFEKERHHKIEHEPTVTKDLITILEDAKKKDALIVYVINVFSFEAAFSSKINQTIKGSEILVIVNKIDLLPKGTDLEKVKKYIAHQFLLHGLRIKKENILLTSLFDEKTSLGVLQEVYEKKGDRDVYFVGAKLSGRKTAINGLLKIYSNKSSESIVTRTYPGTSTKVMKIPLSRKSAIYNIPPIDDDNSILHDLDRTSLRFIFLDGHVKARKVHLNNKQSLFIGGLALVEVINEKKVSLECYFSPKVELLRVIKKNSDVRFIKAIEKKSVKPVLNRTKTIYDFDVYEVDIDENGERDIGIQGLGWFTFKAEDQAFRIFVPKGVSIYTSSTKVLKKEK